MAVDVFFKLGDVKGESEDHKHKGSIDVLAWSWGVSNSGNTHVGTGSGSGKVNVQDLSFTKYIDVSTPDLLLAACNGKHYKEAVLTVRKAGEKPLEYLKITMEDLSVTSVSMGGSGGEDRLTESVSVNFGRVKVDYTQQLATGAEGAKPKMGWDITKNEKI